MSCVGYSQDIKAIRAALAAEVNRPMRIRGIHLAGPQGSIAPGDVWCLKGTKYTCEIHRLGLGSCHALFICRRKGFLLDGSDQALWNELKDSRFTTPLLRGWLPYLKQELEARGLLQSCYVFDCDCKMLTTGTKDLDEIVEQGLQSGEISIREDAA
jgi:hypothetical protein